MKAIRLSDCRCFTYCLLCALSLLLFIDGAPAQSQFGQITGLVTDQSKGDIVGAYVTITNVDTGVQNKTVTNADDNYTVIPLVPGHYSVS
jgi:hypothetical protein